MKILSSHLVLSAADLSNHMACRHHTTLDLAAAQGLLDDPPIRDPSLAVMQERGLQLENEYLDSLLATGATVSMPGENDKDGIQRTIAAMQAGVDIIYQASLSMKGWIGRADFLKKLPRPDKPDLWSYEVIDTKLSRQTRGSTILQLCLYSEMVAELQGFMPEYMHVVTPGLENNHHSYRLADFLAYYRYMKGQLKSAIASFKSLSDTYPVPCMFCSICNWWEHCDSHRRSDDHLSFVAGLGSGHLSELTRREITTLESLSQVPLPIPFRPDRGAIETYTRLREQARVQAESRASGLLVYEILDIVEGRGFFNLPQPSPGDIFFDIEGDPYVGLQGLEFLFGWISADIPGRYEWRWALNTAGEKRMFEEFIDLMMQRWVNYPDMHIYHFTAYEPSALRRLMGKYATREQAVDQMLRAGLFVDLHTITRQSIRAGIETYSLKELEKLHGFQRQLHLADARQYLRIAQRHLERQENIPLEEDAREAIEIYNKEDCLSAMELRTWLESLRATVINRGTEIPRPIPGNREPGEELTRRQIHIGEMIDQLLEPIPDDPSLRDAGQQAKWLLANMLDWYRREDKAIWWEYFRLIALSAVEMMEERSGIGGLSFTGIRIPQNTLMIDEYSYPSQDVEMRPGDKLRTTGEGIELGEVESLDTNTRTLRIRKKRTTRDLHPDTIFVFTNVPNKVKEDSIQRIAQWVLDHGIDADGSYRAGRDLLMRLPPRPQGGVLPIQGPPGAGKSHRAAEMILDLVRAGKKVGITALSHKVIIGLMHKVIRLAKQQGIRVRCMRKVSELPGVKDPEIIEETSNDIVVSAIHSGNINILGGTAWLWSRADMEKSVDVLVVDEAGQLSLIDTLAVSAAATSLILLGDPQQLQQPQQGSHPEGTEVSALHHILGENKTIPPERGIFLDTTWRMHPSICSFVSELFYENRLGSREHLVNQRLIGKTAFAGSGLYFCGIRHEGNQGSSLEEANYVVELIRGLTAGQISYNDQNNDQRILTATDIKVISPYNAQVNLLTSKLPADVQVGTVDKFQGQEAPVIIFSMATSSSMDAPRGMEFLYSANRFNVAVSRARAVFILVASPGLLQPECNTVDQMRLANAFSRFLELAKRIDIQPHTSE